MSALTEPIEPTADEEQLIVRDFVRQAADQRTLALQAGFSDEAAEAMGVQVHAGLVARYYTA